MRYRVTYRGARGVSHESVDVSLDAFQIIVRDPVMNLGLKNRDKSMIITLNSDVPRCSIVFALVGFHCS